MEASTNVEGGAGEGVKMSGVGKERKGGLG